MDIAKVMDPGSAGSYCVSRTTMGRCEGFTEHYVSACDLIITRSSALLLGNSELIGRRASLRSVARGSVGLARRRSPYVRGAFMCKVHIGCGDLSTHGLVLVLALLLEEDSSCFCMCACSLDTASAAVSRLCEHRGAQGSAFMLHCGAGSVSCTWSSLAGSFALLREPLCTRCASAYEIFITQPDAAMGWP